jgi:hypothetical protein
MLFVSREKQKLERLHKQLRQLKPHPLQKQHLSQKPQHLKQLQKL